MFIISTINQLLTTLYSLYLAKSLTGFLRTNIILFPRRRFRVSIFKSKNSVVKILGQLSFRSHLGSTEPVRIILEEGSTLIIEGDFEIGAGSVILVRTGAVLKIGGKELSAVSGMASNCKILAKESIEIGTDVIMAWDVLVTDSDWHPIEGQQVTKPVKIENKVWLSHHVSIHKGAHIFSGSIIAAHSLVLEDIPSRVIAGGIPAKVLKNNIHWNL